MKNYTESEKEIYLSGYKDGKEETMKTVVSVAEFVGKCWTMFLIDAGLIFLIIVSASKCQAQTISKSETVQQDTIPVTILVRIQGRPWAFFHDGWEVRRKMVVGSVLYDYKKEPEYLPVYDYSHLLYLDSKKRPIRKEWVVYQTFKR